MLTRRHLLAGGSAIGAMALLDALAGCAAMGNNGGWITLIDGTRVPESWIHQGAGNWSVVDGSLQGKDGKAGFLTSPDNYADFELRAEFWADAEANSGIFIRCENPTQVGTSTAYEVNIFDKRPDPSYGTGAIVDIARVAKPYPQAANRWNTLEVVARGARLTVSFNGMQTVDVVDGKRRSGRISLQSAGGTVRFRKVMVRPL